MTPLKMTKELKDSIDTSKKENATSFLKTVQVAYATSAAVKDCGSRNKALQKAGKSLEGVETLYEGDLYFYDGKEDETEFTKFIKLPEVLDVVVFNIRGEVEAIKDIRSKDNKKTLDSVTLPFDPEFPQFIKREEYTEFCEQFEDRDDVTIKLSHSVLVYIPSLDTFAILFYKYSTTEDYAQLFDCIGEGEVVNIRVYTQELKGGGVWNRFRAQSTGKLFEASDEHFTERLTSAMSLFN